MGPGDLSLVPAWEPHGFRSVSRDATVLVIFFTPAFLGEEMLGELSWLGLFLTEARHRPRPTSEAMRRSVSQISAELVAEVERRGDTARGPGDAAWVTAMRLGVLRLLFAVARDWAPPEGGGRHHGHPSDLARVSPAVSFVQSRPGRRVRLEEAARVCALSPSRFGAIFRRGMGVSFGQFALRSRLAQAAQLMLSTEAPLEVVAEQTGFGGASHLHHAFTKCYGCTPAAYRKQAQP
jgi:transcriptional regulator GlxA family with amidase domain